MTGTNKYIIYHANCMDGLFAAAAAVSFLGDDVILIPLAYNEYEFDEEISTLKKPGGGTFDMKGARVYILDFSFPRVIMDRIISAAVYTVWLDHHKTAFELYGVESCADFFRTEGRSYLHLSDEKSGALLAWEYFYPDTVIPPLILDIDDRDRWQHKRIWSGRVHAALLLQEELDPIAAAEMLHEPKTYVRLVQDGNIALKVSASMQERIVEEWRTCNVLGKYGRAINSPVLQSELGNELAVDCGSYGLVWHTMSDGRVKVSLRSTGDYDVAELAKQFGGGGHKNAAGFTCSSAVLNSFFSGGDRYEI